MVYTTRQIGAANTLEYKVYVEEDGKVISPFHDIPLFADESKKILNMVVEIPRWTNDLLEIVSHIMVIFIIMVLSHKLGKIQIMNIQKQELMVIMIH
ncbi:unnamed protein product [[Candida] boidinii]|nr:unnamed protein product [[Candida] boidinii]